MIRGLYISMTGMNSGAKRQDTIANNLANANTAGYKRTEAVFSSLLERRINHYVEGVKNNYLGLLGTGTNFRQGVTDFSVGQILPSESKLDIALSNPDAYLAVEDKGNIAYTRNGELWVDQQGTLRHVSGAYVLGGQDPAARTRIQVPQGDELRIETDGRLRRANGQESGRLCLVKFDPAATKTRMGDSLFGSDRITQAVEQPGVVQGALEHANVQVVKEMVNLIAAMRYYETNSKLIQIQDQTLDKAVNEVGRT